MGYMKIPNLYRNQAILLFKECFAMEKVHGTSTRVSWKDGNLTFSSGGAKHETFVAFFEVDALRDRFAEHFGEGSSIQVYGEAYGGSQQKMAAVYGPKLCFIAFEVQIDGHWLAVPQAADVVEKLGLEFVPYALVPATVEALDAERDRNSIVAERRGMGIDKRREGIVARPLIEVTTNNDQRLIAKHKGDEFRETATPRPVDDPAKLVQLTTANDIALEWVTPMRLQHVLDKIPGVADGLEMRHTNDVVKATVADVLEEAGAEIVDNKIVRKAIGQRAAALFHQHLKGPQ
jgi:hypothetical protein